MTNHLEARKAITNLNGVILWGKPIRVGRISNVEWVE
jgi:hypothetical protein